MNFQRVSHMSITHSCTLQSAEIDTDNSFLPLFFHFRVTRILASNLFAIKDSGNLLQRSPLCLWEEEIYRHQEPG